MKTFNFLLLFVVALPAAVPAQLVFTTNNGAITITGYTGTPTAINIPGTTNGYPVTVIGTNAFGSCSSLTNVTIPNSVTNIDYGAFFDTGLTQITIPDSVASIGGGAFAQTSLTSVTIPDTVTSIGMYAFSDCDSLTNVNIGNGVASIADYTFFYSSDLTTVTIGSGVTNIGEYSFYNCTGLTNIIIPDNVISIGPGAFAYSGLNSISIGSGVIDITNTGEIIFDYCTNLTQITVAPGNPSFSSAGGVMFDTSQTTLVQFPIGRNGSYTVPNSVTNIAAFAFAVCEGLTNVNLGSGLTSIGKDAFVDTGLLGITLPGHVANIGDYAFADCVNLAHVSIGSGATSLGNEEFWGCTSLTSITIPSSVTSLGDHAFVFCNNLDTVYFAGNAPSLGLNSFTDYPDGFINNPTTYYLPGTTGWTIFNALSEISPAVLWNPQAQTSDSSFGFHTNQFGFNITGSSGITIVVEACTNLTNPVWQPVQTNTLTSGSAYFNDPQWADSIGRFYRFRSP